MIVSHKHRFIFVKTYKVGGTSVELWLRKILGGGDISTPTSDDEKYVSMGYPPPQNYLPPFEAHLPAHRIKGELGVVWDDYLKFSIERDPYERLISHWNFYGRPSPFPEFVKEKGVQYGWHNHSRYCIEGQVSVDKLLRYEYLEEDLTLLLQSLGVGEPVRLPSAKSGFRKEGYTSNEEDRRLVELEFSDDFEVYRRLKDPNCPWRVAS